MAQIYQEDFNSQGNWTRDNNDIRALYVSNGMYYFEHKKQTGFREFTTRSFTINTSRDFEFTTSIKKVFGETDYGISFLYDYEDESNYSEFAFTSTGYYRVAESTTQSKFKNIKSWTRSSAIAKGVKTNDLKVKKTGSMITFYINDTRVYMMDFKSLKGRKMAIRVYRNQKIAVDYLRVKYNNSSSTTSLNSTPKGKTILFEGYNSNVNDWSEQDDSNARLAVEGGNYVMNHRRSSGGWSSTINKYINTSRDFRISAQIKKVAGISNNGFGITFGKKDNDNQNHFLISSNGSYKIVQYKNGVRTYPKNWTKSSFIKTGDNVVNYLKIQKKKDAYKFYINNSLVFTSFSTKFYGNRVGFTVYDKQTVKIGYLSIFYAKANSTTASKENVRGGTGSSNSINKHVVNEIILFDGYYNNKNNWSLDSNESVKFELKNGNYFFDHLRDKGGWSSTIDKYIDTSRDFKILADMKKESGILNNGYGILFGRKDSNNQNLFYVNGNGSYSINKMKDGKNNFLKKWVKDDIIRKGNGGYNVLKVVKIGSKLEYYINDKKVYTDYYPKFFGDRFGYVVYNRQKVSIDYLSVGYLDKKTTSTISSSTLNSTSVTDKVESYTYDSTGYHFSDQFNNNGNSWFVKNDDKRNFRIKNGKYYLKHKGSFKEAATSDYNYIDTNKDFEIQTKLDKIAGKNNYGYGLIFGKQDLNDFRFYISSNGSYKISKRISNIEVPIKDWTSSSYINKGNNKSNILKVKKQKGFYKFYINGAFVFQTAFQGFFGNDLGFVVHNNQEIAVDYIRVKYEGSFVND
ncbi:hypothetical protein BTO06_03380 [Tenacibaculum sp. SZ-18]|nr:hypothetical protein BTO06_03380 [Tenacibaculum sp. SZ-18]